MKRSRLQGFTLIELMITVAVIGILSAIALPMYSDAVLKGKRTEGRTALSELMLQQERFMTQSGSYRAFAPGATSLGFKTFSGSSAASSAYLIGAEACTGTSLKECVRVYAVPEKPDPKVNIMSITSVGEKTCDGTLQNACWK